MIDTIKFVINIDEELHKQLLRECIEKKYRISMFGNKINTFNNLVNLPTFNRDINIFNYTDRQIYIEFSVPKLVFKHNVRMIDELQLRKALVELQADLQAQYRHFPPLSDWYLQRLDICYNWFTHSEETVKEYLSGLAKFSSRRKNRQPYDNGNFSDIGSKYSIKFYAKHEEYKKNDFRELEKINPEYAHQVKDLSVGVLRFEVKLTKEALKDIFGQNLRWSNIEINNNVIKSLLELNLNKYLAGLKSMGMSTEQIQNKLIEKFGINYANSLYGFYVNRNKKKYVAKFSKKTAYRYRKDLKAAGIGIQTKHSLPNLVIGSFA